MSRSKKIWLGFFTFFPIVVTFLAVIGFVITFMGAFAGAASGNEEVVPFIFAGGFITFFILILISAIIDFIITVYFIADVVQDKNIDETEKIIWVVALFFVSFFSTAAYWFARIWNREDVKGIDKHYQN